MELAEAEQTARKELERANRTRQIVEDPIFRDAVQAVRDQLYKDFAKSDLGDDRKRLSARIGVDLLETLLTALEKHMQTGKMAEHTLAEIDAKKTMLDRHKRAG